MPACIFWMSRLPVWIRQREINILRTIINNYNPEATVLISTHLIEDVEQVLDEVIFMRYGQLVLYTSVDNIREEKGKSVDAYFREVFAC